MTVVTMQQMTETMAARQRDLSEQMSTAEQRFQEEQAPRVAEHTRLTRALDALNGANGAASTSPRRRSRSGRPKGSKRADDALSIIKANPDVTIPELAERMGIKPNYLYRVVPALVEEGKVMRTGGSLRATS